MDQVVPWKKLCEIIKPYHQEPPTGRKPITIERKLRIICFQQWYNTEHSHSGIDYVTPQQAHDGLRERITAQRAT
ncbi:hypothetical protein ACFLZQ_03265 [Thermodesulfobacteriota bacterium]